MQEHPNQSRSPASIFSLFFKSFSQRCARICTNVHNLLICCISSIFTAKQILQSLRCNVETREIDLVKFPSPCDTYVSKYSKEIRRVYSCHGNYTSQTSSNGSRTINGDLFLVRLLRFSFRPKTSRPPRK